MTFEKIKKLNSIDDIIFRPNSPEIYSEGKGYYISNLLELSDGTGPVWRLPVKSARNI